MWGGVRRSAALASGKIIACSSYDSFPLRIGRRLSSQHEYRQQLARQGLPCVADGGPGVKARYDFDEVSDWLWHNSLFQFANYEEPDVVIADARKRASAIGRAR
jgi:hypothetical protein